MVKEDAHCLNECACNNFPSIQLQPITIRMVLLLVIAHSMSCNLAAAKNSARCAAENWQMHQLGSTCQEKTGLGTMLCSIHHAYGIVSKTPDTHNACPQLQQNEVIERSHCIQIWYKDGTKK